MTPDEQLFIKREKAIAAAIEQSSCKFQNCIQQALEPAISAVAANMAGYHLNNMVQSLDRLELHFAKSGMAFFEMVSDPLPQVPVGIWYDEGNKLPYRLQHINWGRHNGYSEPTRASPSRG